jgi:hypothetical protein
MTPSNSSSYLDEVFFFPIHNSHVCLHILFFVSFLVLLRIHTHIHTLIYYFNFLSISRYCFFFLGGGNQEIYSPLFPKTPVHGPFLPQNFPARSARQRGVVYIKSPKFSRAGCATVRKYMHKMPQHCLPGDVYIKSPKI